MEMIGVRLTGSFYLRGVDHDVVKTVNRTMNKNLQDC